MDFERQIADMVRGNTWRALKGDPFYGVSLKIERADFHINDLQLQINAFLARNPYKVVAEKYAEAGVIGFAWTLRVGESIPEHFPNIIGDAIHNLRDALDHSVSAIARSTGHSDRGKYFPSANSPESFKAAIEEGLEKWAPTKVINVLKTGIQPYFGGHSPLLRSLHKLSVIDKHRLIAPVISEVEMRYIPRGAGETPIPLLHRVAGPIEDGAILTTTSRYGGAQIGDEANTAFFIGFNESDARVDYLKVVPTLLAMRNAVEDAQLWLRECIDPPIG